MDDTRLSWILRTVRRRLRLRQIDVARRAGVSRETVGRAERPGAGQLPLDTLRGIAAALDLRLDIVMRWRGGDLDRVVNSSHAALHESIASHLRRLGGWTWIPEVSFSIYGERGVIDILAWHAATRCLLIIGLKTELADPQGLVAVMGTRVRLAHRIARDHGWAPAHVSAWVVISDTKTNRRRLAKHGESLRTAFPTDGRSMAAWMRRPSGPVQALSFWTDDGDKTLRTEIGQVRRVRSSQQPRPRA